MARQLGSEPLIWLDALDLPLFVCFEGSYAIEGPYRPRTTVPTPARLNIALPGWYHHDNPLPSCAAIQ